MPTEEPIEPTGPTWVRKRGGRIEPFEPERINGVLFAATEALGQADPFRARELTDCVVHFLERETYRGTIDATDVRDVMIKVVRELGHPELAFVLDRTHATEPAPVGTHTPARAEARCGPLRSQLGDWLRSMPSPQTLRERISTTALEQYGLEAVYGKNLIAAHRERLLELGNLAAPLEFASLVLRPQDFPDHGMLLHADTLCALIERASHLTGDVLAIDARIDPFKTLFFGDRGRNDLLTVVGQAVAAAGLKCIVNVGPNVTELAASSAGDANLFTSRGTPSGDVHPNTLVDAMIARVDLLQLHWHWHLSELDFADDAALHRLRRLLRAFRATGRLTFACERSDRACDLGDGLAWRYPAILCWVGLNLDELRRRFPNAEGEAFLGKVRSLTRLAVSVGTQKRHFLRERGRPGRPTFLLENARLGIYVVGLSDAATYKAIKECVAHEARITHVSSVLDDAKADVMTLPSEQRERDSALKRWGRRHGMQDNGTLRLAPPDWQQHNVDTAVEILRCTFASTAVHRLRFEPPMHAAQHQLVTTQEVT